MSTETRLKPCPFCGGAARELNRFNANVITCRRCGVKVRQSEMGQGDAAEQWNKRFAPVSAEPVAVPDAILLMAQRIAADDFEHCTSDPIFTVEKRNLITGLDLDYTDNIGWFCEGEQMDDEDAAVLEAAYQESGNVPDNYTRTGIEETWEHFATYVTLEAAREFVSKKGDRYRVYVDSGCRNHEWKALRAFLLQIAANPVIAAPVAAQPDLTQQTLDDVKAGIPARDAEIEALRKELETLQAAQAQPTGLVKQLCDALELAKTCHGAMLMSDPPQEMWKARGVDRVISEALNAAQAQLPVSGAVQFRDAAQMIEPSGNSGELDELKAFEIELRRQCFQQPTHAARDLAWCMWRARAALAQQDADKVDAERWRAYRAAIAAEDSAFLGRGESYLSSLGLRAEVLPTEEQIDAAIDAARKEPGQ